MNDTIMSEIMGQLAGDEFKHWASHIAAREHIRLERLDNNKQFAEMRTLLEADDDRAAFLKWHMTTPVFGPWNYDTRGPLRVG